MSLISFEQKAKLGQILLARGAVNEEQIARALAKQRDEGHRFLLGELLIEMGYCTEDQIASALAEGYGVPYAQVSPGLCDPKAVELLPADFLAQHGALPLSREHDVLTVAVSEPANIFLIDEIQQISGCRVKVVCSTLKDIKAALRTYLREAQRLRPLDTNLRRALDQLEADVTGPGSRHTAIVDPSKVTVARRLPKGTTLDFLRSDKPGHVSARLRLPAQLHCCEFTNLPVKKGVVALPITIVFLCHSRQDRPAVEKIADQLQSAGFYVWIDKKDLLPGDPWEEVIEDAIETADFVLVCLSQRSLEKRGYYWREIRYALHQRDLRPEGERFIIPVMIEKVDIPRRFSEIHCEDLTQPGWLERLAMAMSPDPDQG